MRMTNCWQICDRTATVYASLIVISVSYLAMPPQEITSPHNPSIKRAAALRDARQRRKQQRFLIDGARELLRGVEAGIHLEEVFVCPAVCRSEECQTAVAKLDEKRTRVLTVSPELMQRI